MKFTDSSIICASNKSEMKMVEEEAHIISCRLNRSFHVNFCPTTVARDSRKAVLLSYLVYNSE